MKNLFLAVIATGLIFATSCKKEEMPIQQTNSSWKTSDWVLVKTGITIQGTECNLYENTKTHQQVYEAQEQNRASDVKWTGTKHVDCFDHITCPANTKPTNCTNATIDGTEVVIIKKEK